MVSKLLDEEAIFKVAAGIPSEDIRNNYLHQVCGDDDTLLSRVETLLEAYDEAPRYLESLPPGITPAAGLSFITERPGSEIGPYKLLEELGQGGMGVVYRAEQKEAGSREVALKIVKPGMDTDQVLARFEAEREALALMDHPHIAKVLDGGSTESGRPYFVMELVRGVPITEYCDQRKLNARERLELFAKVCDAVQHAHMKGIIHRDVKPNNVLIEEHEGDAAPKVIDFGIAKAIDQRLTERSLFTHFGQMVGTPLYMSPEQAQLGGRDVDTRTDIYSLGVLLYELLSGATPFDRDQLRRAGYDELRRLIQEEEPLRPSEKVRTLSAEQLSTIADSRQFDSQHLHEFLRGELDWIVTKAMEKDRGRRYGTVEDFSADVRRFLNDDPVQACPPSTAYRLRKFAKRNKTAVIVAVIVCVAMCVAIVALAVSNWMVREQRSEARRQAAIAQAANEFITIVLSGSADAHYAPNRDLKVREVLSRATVDMEKRFTDQPIVEAAVRYTLGETYRALGEVEQAKQHATIAYERRRQELGPAHADTLHAAISLARVYHDEEDYARSLQLFERTYRLARDSRGDEDESTLRCQVGIADIKRHLGEYLKAEALSTDVLETSRRLFGDEHSNTLEAAHFRALALRDQSLYDEAQTILEEVLEIRRRVLGAEHPQTLGTMEDLAVVLNNIGKCVDAEDLFQQLSAIRQSVQGAEHPKAMSSRESLAVTLTNQGRHGEAEVILRELLEFSQSELGPEHPRTLSALDKLSHTLGKQAEVDEASELIHSALNIRRGTLGVEHPDTLRSMHALGVSYTKQRRYEDAERIFAELVDIQQRLHGKEHPNTLHNVKHLQDVVAASRDSAAMR